MQQLPGDALAEVVAELTDAGIRATTEPKNFQIPGALVVPGTIDFDILGDDAYSMVIDIYLLPRKNGTHIQAMNDAAEMLIKLRTVFEVPNAEPISISLPNLSTDPVPGLLISLQATITKD